jgi:type IV pilus assembly protein PilA
MKIYTKYQLIRQLVAKDTNAGFTLVELLVVVIIIGILTAISLPAYLTLTAGAKQTEARQNIAALMTAQQVWIDENSSGVYPASLDQLAVAVAKGTGLVDNTTSSVYTYSISSGVNQMSSGAAPKDIKLRAYSGGVRSFFNAGNQATWFSVSCESGAANEILAYPVPVGPPTNASLDCPAAYAPIAVAGR